MRAAGQKMKCRSKIKRRFKGQSRAKEREKERQETLSEKYEESRLRLDRISSLWYMEECVSFFDTQLVFNERSLK